MDFFASKIIKRKPCRIPSRTMFSRDWRSQAAERGMLRGFVVGGTAFRPFLRFELDFSLPAAYIMQASHADADPVSPAKRRINVKDKYSL